MLDDTLAVTRAAGLIEQRNTRQALTQAGETLALRIRQTEGVMEWEQRLLKDLGTISEVPEEIKFSTFRHGLGLELAFDTPIGQAALGVGKSFYFNGYLPNNPVQQGPLLWYFVIGYQF